MIVDRLLVACWCSTYPCCRSSNGGYYVSAFQESSLAAILRFHPLNTKPYCDEAEAVAIHPKSYDISFHIMH